MDKMDKVRIQDQELDQVSGGKSMLYHDCPKCYNRYFRGDKYPKGWFYGERKDGCSYWTVNKCPNCGYTFESC